VDWFETGALAFLGTHIVKKMPSLENQDIRNGCVAATSKEGPDRKIKLARFCGLRDRELVYKPRIVQGCDSNGLCNPDQ